MTSLMLVVASNISICFYQQFRVQAESYASCNSDIMAVSNAPDGQDLLL